MILDRIFRPRSAERQFSLDATRTDRLNEAHWEDANDDPINVYLASELSTMRARSQWEFLNNPIVKGVVRTYRDDMVGPHGPALTVQSDDDEYNTSLEQIWREWFKKPDLNGVHSGADLLGLSMTQLFTAGDYLWQIVTDPDAKGPVAMRVLLIHSRRMSTPYDKVVDENVAIGVRRSETGRPIEYYIEKAPTGEGFQRYSMEYATVPAKDMIHGFEYVEADQVRGLPWLQSCLPVAAKLREYDEWVLDAAQQAAAMGVLLFTKDPAAGVATVNTSTSLEKGTMRTIPPGYEAMQVNPNQPPAGYPDFRAERLRELGRPFGMPLLTVQCDARGHSWSSARLDRDVYHSGLRVQQGQTDRVGLNRLLDIVRREAEVGLAIPLMRKDYTYVWTWPVFSSIDPMKESKGADGRLTSGTTHLAYECAQLGLDWEEVINQRAREQEMLKAKDLYQEPEEKKPGDEDDDDEKGTQSND